ncbi:thiamine biosynthesis protein [Podospora conica]|nr:thiamine biosynthesis protein [Schizothecium conicum]
MGRVLVIAGSDSSGGAGIEADQKVIAAHACYALTATTALTAQDTSGVHAIHHVPSAFVRQQIDLCLADIGADVIKTGMLASRATVVAVAEALAEHPDIPVVLDPVVVSTSGAALLPPEALRAVREELMGRATVVTPNLPEARLLLADAGLGHFGSGNVKEMAEMARAVQGLGGKWVLLKGGHCPMTRGGREARVEAEREVVVDVLVGPGEGEWRFETPFWEGTSTHGTGCSLASAIASNMAKGMEVPQAVRAACRYVEAGIKTAPGWGKGNGPLNHFHSTYTLPFAPGHFIDYLLERPDVAPVWHQFVNHPFVLAMGDATLPLESFKGYLIQDYLYLVHFARANALASYKAKTLQDITASATIVAHIAREMKLHIDYCKGFGISVEEIESTEENMACTAYTRRYVLDIGQSQDWIGLQLALAPCLLGYGALAAHLHKNPASKRTEENPYWTWIENYVAEDYVTAVKTGSELIERHAVQQSMHRIEELVKIFIHATRMEIAFWEMYASA